MKAPNSVILQIGDCYIVQKEDGSFIVASHPQRYVELSRDTLKEEIANLINRVINEGIDAYEQGKRDTLAKVKEIIGECPDCSEAARVLVLNKLRKLL